MPLAATSHTQIQDYVARNAQLARKIFHAGKTKKKRATKSRHLDDIPNDAGEVGESSQTGERSAHLHRESRERERERLLLAPRTCSISPSRRTQRQRHTSTTASSLGGFWVFDVPDEAVTSISDEATRGSLNAIAA